MNDDLEELITPAELERQFLELALEGDDTLQWTHTPIGRAVVRRAKDDYMTAIHSFAEVDLNDAGKLRELQMSAQVSLRLIKYLASAINDGKTAIESLNQDHQ